MSARYLVCVVKGGEYRVVQYGHEFQYGQWEGYFERHGKEIVRFLTTADLTRFGSQVDKITVLTADQVKQRWDHARTDARCRFGYDVPLEALHLSPEYGTNILGYVLNTASPEVYHSLDFAGDSLFCEFAYVINLDNCSLEIFLGFNRTPLTPGERFYGFENRPVNQDDFARRHASGKPYYPIKRLRTIPFAELTVADLAMARQ